MFANIFMIFVIVFILFLGANNVAGKRTINEMNVSRPKKPENTILPISDTRVEPISVEVAPIDHTIHQLPPMFTPASIPLIGNRFTTDQHSDRPKRSVKFNKIRSERYYDVETGNIVMNQKNNT